MPGWLAARPVARSRDGHELGSRVFTPSAPSGVTALVFGGGAELEPADLALSERFSAWGALTVACHLGRDGEVLSDRDATAMATAALSELLARDGVDRERVVIAGCGRGGTLAVLCACRMDGGRAHAMKFLPLPNGFCRQSRL